MTLFGAEKAAREHRPLALSEQLRRSRRLKIPFNLAAGVAALLLLLGYMAGLRAGKGASGVLISQPRGTHYEKGFASAGAAGLRSAAGFDTSSLPALTRSLQAAGDLLVPHASAGSGSTEVDVIYSQQLSWYPRVTLFRGFASEAECDAVIAAATPRLSRSHVAYKSADEEGTQENVRTSFGTFMTSGDDASGTLRRLEAKISRVTHLPVNHGEAFNILRYVPGQHYAAHQDTFDPAAYGPQPSQRMATFLVYLEVPEEGGETIFPLEGEHGLERQANIDYDACSMGLKAKPNRGDGVLFYSLHPNRTFDTHALHGACPPVKGKKMVAVKWIRDEIL